MQWYIFSSLVDKDATLSEFIKEIKKNIDKQSEPHAAKEKLYRNQTKKAISYEPIGKDGNFWDRNFGEKRKEVKWNEFQKTFETEFKTEMSELCKTEESSQWLLNVLKNDVFEGTDKVTKDNFLKLRGQSVHKKHFWKIVNDKATEKYCINEVFNMDSAVRLTAVENLG